MSRSDIMGLGPFQKELGRKLGSLSKDELSRILLAHGKTVKSSERRAFLALFDAPPPAEVRKNDPEDDKTLLEDIRAFIADLENGKYYEGTGFDEETRDYRSYGDESWVDEMDELFARAEAAFLIGKRKAAADAYGLLLHAFELGEEDGHFCGATYPDEMVATDITEAKARYLRALFETIPASQRPKRILEEMCALRYRGQSEEGITVIIEADVAPPLEWGAFLNAWIELLRNQDPDETGLIELEMSRRLLREAVLMKDGVEGLAKLAGEQGAQDPKIFSDWLDTLLQQERKGEAREVARRAVETIKDPAAKAHLAERWAVLVENDADRLEAARIAWRSEPSVARLLILNSVNRPSVDEATRRIAEAVRYWRTEKPALDDRTASVMLILAGQYDEAVDLMAKSKPLGWSSYDHSGPVTYPFVLLAVIGGQTLPKGSVLSLWRHELDAADRLGDPFQEAAMVGSGQASGAGLWAAMQSVLEHKPLTETQKRGFLDTAKKVMLARVRGIANARHRGAYDRAARMLAGWIEAARLTGRSEEAQGVLERLIKDYSRLSSFKREIKALLPQEKQ